MKAVVAAFNQEKALVGAFSVITNLRMELFEALLARGGGEDGMSGSNFEKLVVAANSWNRHPERKTLIQLLHNPTHLAKSKCHYE